MPSYTNLILRTLTSPYGDVTRGGVLSWNDVDQNFLYLKGQSIYGVETSGVTVTLKKYNGSDIIFDVPKDIYVTGGTYNSGTATFVNNNGDEFYVTGFTGTDTFVTGFTYSSNTITLYRNQGLSALTVDINTMTGLTVNGILSATTIFGDGNGLTNIDISSINNLQTSLDNKFDKSGGTVNGNVIVTGDITILGTATTINTETITVKDNIITINSNYSGNTLPYPGNSGIEVLRGSATTATLLWDESNQYWTAGISGNTKQIILSGDSLSLLNSGHTHPISEIVNLQNELDNKFDKSGGTISGNVIVTNNTILQSTSATTLNLTNLPTQNNSATDILVRNTSTGDVEYIPVSAITPDTNTYVTGYTYDDANTFTITSNGYSALTATINSVTGLTVNGTLSATTIFGDGNGLTNIDISSINNLQTSLDNKFDKSGGTINGNLIVTGNTELQSLTATTISATTYYNLPLDVYVTGGTYNGGTATFTNNNGVPFDVTGFTSTDTFVTGFTYSSNTLTIQQNQNETDLNVIIDVMTGLTINGTLSATTIFGDGNGLTNIDISSINNLQPSLDSKIDKPASPAFDDYLYYNGSTWVSNKIQIPVSAGASVTFYLNTSGGTLGGYDLLSSSPTLTAQTIESVTVNNSISQIQQYSTEYLNRTVIDAGIWEYNIYAGFDNVSTGYTNILVGTYLKTTGGSETLLFTGETNEMIASGITLYTISIVQPSFICNLTDRLIVRYSGSTTNNTNTTIDLYHGGIDNYSHIHTPFITLHNNLAGIQGGSSDNYYHLELSQLNLLTTGVDASSLHNHYSTVLGLSGGTVTGSTTFTNGLYSNNISATTISGDGNGLTNIDISSINNLQNELNTKFDKSGGTINGDLYVTGNTLLQSLTATTISATTISATTYYNLPLDIYVTGGTYNNGTATFTNNNGVPFDVTGFTSTDTFVTGFTYSSNTLTIQQNQNETDLNVIIDVMTGLTVNGSLSATTIFGDGNGLTNIDITSINNLQNELNTKFDVSGGTIYGNLNVTGDTIVQSLTATTISATTYLNLPVVSGVLGISNSGGTYTYYSAFTQALTASISGQTIEVFADIIETNDISLTLKDGVNINGNGHTYILNTSGISDCFIDGGSPITAVTSNLNVIRTGRSNGDLTGTTFNFSNVNNDITFINTNCYNTFGNGIILGNGTYKGVVSKGYLNGITSTNGNVYNAIGESLNSGYGIYSTGGTLHDSTGIAISSSGISWKGSVYKSIGKSSTSNGLGGNDETGPYYNSVGVSNSGNAIYSATCYNCNAISNSGIAYDSCNIHNSVGISNSNYALYTPSSNFVCNNSYLESTSNYVIYQRGSIFKNNTIVSKYNNTSGHAIYTWDNTDISIIVNNSIKVENSSAYGITGVSGSLMKYSNNIFEGCLIPVDSTNITQSIINTQDNQGNIVL